MSIKKLSSFEFEDKLYILTALYFDFDFSFDVLRTSFKDIDDLKKIFINLNQVQRDSLLASLFREAVND